jgi:hypothetical protein
MILLVFVAMVAIVAIAGFIGYTVTRNSMPGGTGYIPAGERLREPPGVQSVTNVTRPAEIWQADSARANLAEDSAAAAVEGIATDTAGSLVLTPTSEGRRTR